MQPEKSECLLQSVSIQYVCETESFCFVSIDRIS